MSKRKNDKQIPTTSLELHMQIADLKQELAKARIALRNEIKESNSDPLTGIFNKRGLEKMISQEINKNGIVLCIDMRYLKIINDKYGHAAGDLAIRTFAEKLSQVMRKTDIVARTGGDEFVVIMTDTTPLESGARRHEIKKALKNVEFNFNGQNLSVGVRIGFARYNQDITLEDAKILADRREGLIRDNLRKYDAPRYS